MGESMKKNINNTAEIKQNILNKQEFGENDSVSK